MTHLNNTKIPKVIILLGAPGSGKGTQGKRLSAELQSPQISTGDLFRENMAKETPLGKKAKSYIQDGQLVPDDLVLNMFSERISSSDCVNGYILDGFPRTIKQAEALEHFLNPKVVVMALNLDVPDDVIIKRAAGRLICKQCGTIYNREISPPVHEGICDKCQGTVYQRSDDAPEVVKERLKVYHLQTQPLLEFYKSKKVLKEFDGHLPPDVVHAHLKRFIDDHS